MKEWYSAAELTIKQIAEVLGLPERTARFRAVRDKWPFTDEILTTGAKRRLYRVASLPSQIREALHRRHLSQRQTTEIILPPVKDLSALKDHQRQRMEARAILLAEIDRMMLLGSSRGEAVETLVSLAREGGLAEGLMKAVRMANARAGENRALSRATLYNWLAAREENGVAALVPADCGEAAIPAWAGILLEEWGRPQKPALTAAVEVTRRRCPTDIEPPSIPQARRFLAKLDSLSRAAGRLGPRALKSLKAYKARDASELWPGAVFIGDGHTFKAEVAHPIHGRPFRPEVTSIIDIYTRKLVGWSVALAENTWSVADALRHAVTSTTLCDIFYYDRGSGAKNKVWDEAATGLAARLSITKMHSLPYNSQARGVIEVYHRHVLHPAAQRLLTYVGSKMDAEAKQRAFKVTRKEIKEFGHSRHLPSWNDFLALMEETIQAYNAKPHSSLAKMIDEQGRRRHMSPTEAWAAAEAAGWRNDAVSAEESLDLFRPVVQRKTTRGLVRFNSNEYFFPALEALHGETVLVAYDIHDGSRVWVRDMAGRMIGEALWNAHRSSYVPVSVARTAQESRTAGRLRRLEVHADEARAELEPGRLIEAGAEMVMPVAIEISEPEPVVSQARLHQFGGAGGRPTFADDISWAAWLAANPVEATKNDIELLRINLRSSSFLSLLEWNGVVATTLWSIAKNNQEAA